MSCQAFRHSVEISGRADESLTVVCFFIDTIILSLHPVLVMPSVLNAAYSFDRFFEYLLSSPDPNTAGVLDRDALATIDPSAP